MHVHALCITGLVDNLDSVPGGVLNAAATADAATAAGGVDREVFRDMLQPLQRAGRELGAGDVLVELAEGPAHLARDCAGGGRLGPAARQRRRCGSGRPVQRRQFPRVHVPPRFLAPRPARASRDTLFFFFFFFFLLLCQAPAAAAAAVAAEAAC